MDPSGDKADHRTGVFPCLERCSLNRQMDKYKYLIYTHSAQVEVITCWLHDFQSIVYIILETESAKAKLLMESLALPAFKQPKNGHSSLNRQVWVEVQLSNNTQSMSTAFPENE